MKYDYRYIMIDKDRIHVSHMHFYYKTDEEAIRDIKEIEYGLGSVCIEIGKSLNTAEECNDYYKSIWVKE